MSKKKKTQKKEETVSINYKSYMIRFALIYLANIAVLLSLVYQADIKDGWFFAIVIIALTAKLTNTKFIMDNKRVYTKEERSKFIWASWSLVWFISIIGTVMLTLALAGREALSHLVATFSSMPTMDFILAITALSLVSYAILFLMYAWQPQKELDSLQRQEKI